MDTEVLLERLHVGNRPVSFRFTKGPMAVGPRLWNRHDYFEIAFCSEGKGHLKTLETKHAYRKGTALLTNADEAHVFAPTATSQIQYVQFSREFLGDSLSLVPSRARTDFFLDAFHSGRPGGLVALPLPASLASDTMESFLSIEREWKTRPAGHEDMTRILVLRLLALLSRAPSSPVEESASLADLKARTAVDAVKAHLRAHFADELDPGEIETVSGYSRDHISRVFRKATGYAIRDFLAELRIHEAARLLRRESTPVVDVALRVGFRNLSYFNRWFREVHGESPSRFRHLAEKTPPYRS